MKIILGFEAVGVPAVLVEVAFAALGEFDAFGFEDLLLEVVREGQAAGRTFALGVDDPLPRDLVAGSVHNIADRAGRVAFAEDSGYLAIGHHPPRRDLTDKCVNFFFVFPIARHKSQLSKKVVDF